MYCCIDDADDGMRLPVQSQPTRDERATMCRCKDRPTLPPPLLPSPSPSPLPSPSPSPSFSPSPLPSSSPSPLPLPTPTPSPLPPSPITISFKEMSYSADESDDNITFTIQASQSSSDEFSIEFCTQNSSPISAQGKPCSVNLIIMYKCIRLLTCQVFEILWLLCAH